MATATEAATFSRIFQSEKPNLSPEVARSILAIAFSEKDRTRMNFLSEKARQGKLSRREDEELERYIQCGNLLAIMHSKARRFLRNWGAEN